MSASAITSPSAERGFTLIELLMAMLILTIGLLGLLQTIEVAFQHKAANLLREEAIQVASEQMNKLKVLSYDDITANHSFEMERVVAGGTRRFLVTRLHEERPGVDAKKLTVAISWSFKNVSSRHELYSIKAK